jgi:hypothetical protein
MIKTVFDLEVVQLSYKFSMDTGSMKYNQTNRVLKCINFLKTGDPFEP